MAGGLRELDSLHGDEALWMDTMILSGVRDLQISEIMWIHRSHPATRRKELEGPTETSRIRYVWGMTDDMGKVLRDIHADVPWTSPDVRKETMAQLEQYISYRQPETAAARREDSVGVIQRKVRNRKITELVGSGVSVKAVATLYRLTTRSVAQIVAQSDKTERDDTR